MTTTEEHIAALRAALALKPTPGPWAANTWSDDGPDIAGFSLAANGRLLPLNTMTGSIEEVEANAALIAAAHPAAIRAMLDALDEARRDAERLRMALQFIADWDNFPPVVARDGRLSTYGAEYGSNGQRDYVRSVARAALTNTGA